MRAVVLTVFWLNIVAASCRVLLMAVSDWPRKREPQTLGACVAAALLEIAFCVWLGIVLWVVEGAA